METTLCYIESGGKYLMLHRVKKKNDLNAGKWIGVGGKFEYGESPEECMRREVREETGLKVEKYDYRGIVTFVSDIAEVEYMHLFTIQETSGELITCDEGNLEWVPKERMIELPHWEGDTIFLGLIAGNFPFFSLKLVYQGDRLIDAVLNERKVLLSERLILRPWFAEDADALSAFISDPETGPPAGWPALPGAEVSGLMIQEALSLPGMYAVTLKASGALIGGIGLTFESRPGLYMGASGSEAEIGYSLGKEYRGHGYIDEALRLVTDYGFHTLRLKKIWSGCYVENASSRRVLEKNGFRYDHTEENQELLLLKETRTEDFYSLSEKDS